MQVVMFSVQSVICLPNFKHNTAQLAAMRCYFQRRRIQIGLQCVELGLLVAVSVNRNSVNN